MRNSILGGLLGVLLGGLVFAACGGSAGTAELGITQAELDSQVALLQQQIDNLQAQLDSHAADADAHHERPEGLGLTWCIALEGTFPSRNLTAPIIADDDSTQLASTPQLGSVSLFAGNFAPRGWARCEGQLLPISQFSALYSIVGTQFGGDGITNFALPDLRERYAMHADDITVNVGDVR